MEKNIVAVIDVNPEADRESARATCMDGTHAWVCFAWASIPPGKTLLTDQQITLMIQRIFEHDHGLHAIVGEFTLLSPERVVLLKTLLAHERVYVPHT